MCSSILPWFLPPKLGVAVWFVLRSDMWAEETCHKLKINGEIKQLRFLGFLTIAYLLTYLFKIDCI